MLTIATSEPQHKRSTEGQGERTERTERRHRGRGGRHIRWNAQDKSGGTADRKGGTADKKSWNGRQEKVERPAGKGGTADRKRWNSRQEKVERPTGQGETANLGSINFTQLGARRFVVVNSGPFNGELAARVAALVGAASSGGLTQKQKPNPGGRCVDRVVVERAKVPAPRSTNEITVPRPLRSYVRGGAPVRVWHGLRCCWDRHSCCRRSCRRSTM